MKRERTIEEIRAQTAWYQRQTLLFLKIAVVAQVVALLATIARLMK